MERSEFATRLLAFSSLIERRIERPLIVAGMSVLFVVMLIQIFGRSLDVSTVWTLDLSRYLFLWVVYLGISSGVARRTHVATDLGVFLIPRRFRSAVNTLALALTAAFFLVASYAAFNAFLTRFTGGQSATTMPLPMWVVFSIIPIVTVTGSVHSLAHLFNRDTEEEPDEVPVTGE
jgi:TRAP-type C4-dicarboxylate transport system permease small subunit